MKKIMLIISLILISLSLSGCWNYRELNELAIVSSFAVDKEDEDFILTAQIMNAKKTSTDSSSTSGGQTSPVTVLKSKGKTIHEALRNMVTISPRKLYAGHTDLFIFDERVAYDGIMNMLDFMIRDPETRKQFKVLIAKNDKASDVLKILTPLEALPTQDILENLKVVSEHKGMITEIVYDELLSYLYEPGIEIVIPVITINGNVEKGKKSENTQTTSPDTRMKLIGLSIFKGDKLLGFLNENDSLGYNLIKNNVKYDIIPFKCDKNNFASVEIISINSKNSIKIKNNLPIVNIKINGTGFLSEINCKIDITDTNEIKNINKTLNNTIKDIINKTIINVQNQYNSDIFGFGNYLYKNNHNYWIKNKDNWDEIFPKIKFDINVNINISKRGAISNSVKEG